jgi:hypothetical protein
MEEDPPQAMVLKERVLQLEENKDPDLKTAKLFGYETFEADVVGGSQSLDAGGSVTAKDNFVIE